MPDKQSELVDKPLHANAVSLAKESVDDYAASLIVSQDSRLPETGR